MASRNDKSIKVEDLLLELQQGRFLPLYLFHGEEDLLIEEGIDAIIKHAIDPETRGFSLDVLYGNDIDAKDVVAIASAFPMMGERRVVIVKDADKVITTEQKREILGRYLDQPSPSTVLVFVAEKPDFRLNVYKAFRTHGAVVACQPLYDNRVPEWILERMKRLDRSIARDAAGLLQAHVGSSLRDLRNEMEKLVIYVGDRKTIGLDDVSAVVGLSKNFTVFELQKSIGQGDLRRSIEVLSHMLDAGAVPSVIVANLTRYFQKLWLLPSLRRQARGDAEVAGALGINSFFLKEYESALKAHPVHRVEEAFIFLQEADEALKTSGGDIRTVMTILVHKLARPIATGAIR